jgi:hypothetical protein
MPEYARKFNVSINVLNGDSPMCTPVEFSHSVIEAPQDWKIRCFPNATLLLRGQQSCNLDCVVETPVVASTTDPALTHSFAVRLTGVSTFESDSRNATVNVDLIYPYQCKRATPTFTTLNTNITTYRPDVNTTAVDYPTVAMAPSTSRSLTMSLTNNDSRKCLIRSVVIEAVFDDPGWVVDWPANRMEAELDHDKPLLPTITFTSPADAKEGFYYPVHFNVLQNNQYVYSM